MTSPGCRRAPTHCANAPFSRAAVAVPVRLPEASLPAVGQQDDAENVPPNFVIVTPSPTAAEPMAPVSGGRAQLAAADTAGAQAARAPHTPAFTAQVTSGCKPQLTKQGLAQDMATTLASYKGTTASKGGRPAKDAPTAVELKPYHAMKEGDKRLIIGALTELLRAGPAESDLERYMYLPDLLAALPDGSQAAVAEAV